MTASVTATFLFTDLVDSTATAVRLGRQAAEELRQTHFRLLRGAVQASGGTEVKNLGDGLMVMFSSPSRGLAGAVGMQQALEHHNRSGGERLAVRVGMSAGEAVEDDGDYFGDPVTEAARLCAAALGGQILASEIVRMMVGRHATQTFVPVGPLEVKGLPDPVDVVEVLWEPAMSSGSVPLPGRLVSVAADAMFGFFGRGAELAALEDARKRSHTTRHPQAVFVAGEAGVGKTALVAKIARAAHAEGSVVLFGHSVEDLSVPYQPWVEALETLVRDGDPALVSGLRAAQRGALARLVPEVGEDGARVGDPDMERLLLLEAATEMLAGASQSSPVLVVLDDLHWADAASLQLLRHVIASPAPMEVTITCTYRDTDLGRGDPLSNLLADLHRESNVGRIGLHGLGDDELVELLAAAAGHPLDEGGVGLAHALRRETDGNPFFTAELVRHLAETGGIVAGNDGRWTVAAELDELGLPSSLRDVVGRRVGRLGDDALRVFGLAAVIGREFDLDLLALVADLDEDRLLDLVDAAVGAAVLVEGGPADRYRFAHALTQHILYEELSPARRQRAHQRVAEALEAHSAAQDAATLAELARHWVAATRPTHLDKALGYVRRAGDAARDALAPEEAIRWYQQALDLGARQTPPDERQRAELLAALGTAQRQASRPEYRETLTQAAVLAQQVGAEDVLVQAALGFGEGTVQSLSVGVDAAKPVITAALDCIGAATSPTRARLLAGLAVAHESSTEWRERRALAQDAMDIARSSDDPSTFIEVLDLVHFTLTTPDNFAQHLADVERAVALADRLGDPVLRVRARCSLMWARYVQVDIEGADGAIAEMEALTETVGLPSLRYELARFVTGRLLLAGRASEAEAANDRLLQMGTVAGVPEALEAYGGLLYAIRLHQGHVDDVAEFFITAAAERPSIAALRSAIPLLLCELGRMTEARERLVAEAEGGFEFPYDGSWLAAMAQIADAAATTEQKAVTSALVERLGLLAEHVVTPGGVIVMGAMARPLARLATILGDYDRAESWFTTAHETHAQLRAPFWTAVGQLDHADLCLRRREGDDMRRAEQLATTAAASAAEFGFNGLAARSDRVLRMS
jgi:class 3 adenylate cyclase